MPTAHSKAEFIYGRVRRALQSGRYVPGQRIDPTALAKEFKASATPVRYALYRLVGPGLIADQARSGLHVPLPTEIALRDLYDWMERLLLMACDIGATSRVRPARELEIHSAEDDLVKLTWQLFDAIAGATMQGQLHQTVKRVNDRLAPIRRAKQGLIDHTYDELVQLIRLWQKHDVGALTTALRAYHERRKQLVPCIVAKLSEGNSYLH